MRTSRGRQRPKFGVTLLTSYPSKVARNPHLTAKLQGFGASIFAEMSALAVEHDAVNVGQGFPDFGPPEEVAEAAIRAIRDGHNQYPPAPGLPALRDAISAHQERFWDLHYDPNTEITVTAGATEAVCASLLGLCDTGDEVVMFEPFYDSYLASISLAVATPKVVPLRAESADESFTFDPEDLRHAISSRTRVLLLNNPHNPTGKVFSRAELELIAEACVENDLVAVTDDVYEHLVFDGEYIPLASFPGMRDRTVVISSAGKTFSATGWKIGWVCAPPLLNQAVRTTKQFMTFGNGTPFQHAITFALGMDDSYFESFIINYTARRDRFAEGLRAAGFGVHPCAGTYFISADIRPLGFSDGHDFCRSLPEKAGVAAVPAAAFYSDRRRGNHLVRFAFCKTNALLDEAADRLHKAFGS